MHTIGAGDVAQRVGTPIVPVRGAAATEASFRLAYPAIAAATAVTTINASSALIAIVPRHWDGVGDMRGGSVVVYGKT